MLTTAAFGAIGFVDDYLKIVRRDHHGLRPRYKMGWQIARRRSASASCCSCWRRTGRLQHAADLPVLQAADSRSRLVVSAVRRASCWSPWSNAVNLTDGLDGLAISTFAIAAATFTALAYVTGHRVLADYLLLVRFPQSAELTVFCGALVGAVARIPLVQRLPGGDLHGRRRIAGARRARSARSRS